MSWGYYSGELTDLTSRANPDMFEDARATAIMIGHGGQQLLQAPGQRDRRECSRRRYGAHLHAGTRVKAE